MASAGSDVDISGAPRPGEIFAGKYRIERLLGAGGMGFVLAATHIQLDERVAIKMLLPSLTTHEDTVTRFLREGRAAVKIRSEHVARVIDVATDAGTHYMVMEYLEGCDLAALLLREKQLLPSTAVDYLLQACEAVAEAHAMRIVHRDLKPANLFLINDAEGRPCIKVLDFGISKMSAVECEAGLSMTKTSALMGSPLYMSPEQLKSAKSVDQRADVWAIGVILYELIAGRPPFLAETLPELGALVFSGHVPDIRQWAPATPPGLMEALATCLRTDAAQRFPSVAELAAALAPFGGSQATDSTQRISRVLRSTPRPSSAWSATPIMTKLLAPPNAAAVQTLNTWGSATAPPHALPRARSFNWAVVSVTIGALLLLGGGTFAFLGGRTPPQERQRATATVETMAAIAPTTSTPAALEPSTRVATSATEPLPLRPLPLRPVPLAASPASAASHSQAIAKPTNGFSHDRYE